MKKLILGMMAAALALGAFCQDKIVDPNPLIVSDNSFGSIKVDTKSEFTMVAVPFEGFASQFEDGKPKQNKILARDTIAVEMLNPTDMMSIHNPESTDAKEEFDNYFASLNSWMVGRETLKAMSWSTSGWLTEESMTSYAAPEANQRLVNTGSDVFIGRDVKTLTDEGFSIYAYGQIPKNFPTEPIVLGQGKTMLSAPGSLAYSEVDVNNVKELKWEGVAPINGAPQSENTILLISATNADRIKFYEGVQEKATEWTLYYYGGKWYRFVAGARIGYADKARIPAGNAFWFLKSGQGSASVQWVGASQN